MTAVLLTLALALLAGFQAQAEVPVQPGFNAAKFSGLWHMMATVSNCPVFQSMRDSMKTTAAIVTSLSDGNLSLKMGLPLPGGCKKMDLVFEKTDQPGHYTNSQKGKTDLRVMETDNANYAILHMSRDIDGKKTTTLQLFSRRQELSKKALKRFKELYTTLGLTDNMLVVPPKSDDCVKALRP